MKNYNIVWFCCDQLRWDCISGYGNTHIRTPNMDRLMETGTTFERCYAQNPTCTPSRASFLTGRYPRSCRASITGNTYFSKDETLVTKMFQDHGYVCGLTGKLHLTAMGARDRQENRTDDGYTYFQWADTGMDTHDPGINNYHDWLVEKGVDWYKVYDAPVMGYWPPTGDYPIPSRIKGMPDELHQTTWCVEKGFEFIEQRLADESGSPWCLSINPFAPHPPFDPPQEFKDRIDVKDMPLPLWKEGELDNKPAFQKESYLNGSQSRMLVPGVTVTDDDKRENTREYYALIEHLDYQLGRLIDYLEEKGLRENTIIMFMSDHGEMLGDHGLYWKGGLFYEATIHVPLIISCPGYIKEGLRSNALVELADVAPTILELVGLPVPHYMQAKSLAGILLGTADPDYHKDAVYSEFYHSALASNTVFATMYFDGRYKMVIHHNDPISELYDLQNDPNEFDNLWGLPETRDLCFEYYQKCVNHAVLINEDSVLGRKTAY